MSQITFEEVLSSVRSLPPAEQQRLVRIIAEERQQGGSQTQQNGGIPRLPQKSYEAENRWLREHEAEYAGEWLALDGDRLVSHGTDLKHVHAAAQAAGVEVPYLVKIDAEDALPFGGW